VDGLDGPVLDVAPRLLGAELTSDLGGERHTLSCSLVGRPASRT
jgi:hypothetical protein